MLIIIAIISVIIASFAVFIIYKMHTGHLIGVHAFKFERVYDLALNENGSHKNALSEALLVFKTCPKLRNISSSDIERVVNIIGDVPDPKKVITKIIMGMDSGKALAALKDERLLRRIATIYEEQKGQSA